MVCFTWYFHSKSMKVLSLNDHELTAKLEEHDEKKCDGWQLYAGYIIRQD